MGYIMPARVTVSKAYTSKSWQNKWLIEVVTKDQKFTLFLDDTSIVNDFKFDDPVEVEIRLRSDTKLKNSQNI